MGLHRLVEVKIYENQNSLEPVICHFRFSFYLYHLSFLVYSFLRFKNLIHIRNKNSWHYGGFFWESVRYLQSVIGRVQKKVGRF